MSELIVIKERENWRKVVFRDGGGGLNILVQTRRGPEWDWYFLVAGTDHLTWPEIRKLASLDPEKAQDELTREAEGLGMYEENGGGGE